ncbi:hypothetical protein K469DRAFT_716885 [Zopfia rhizophila CBS 207.26]|uniref:Uncharacterized protein n=1 Tax=Zopfia rhizophila CBS 207.26 TaxID=1314779 RepID=A0A6A6ER16_9PEZI|nr:hypothetical protein K469DRAFT_716885 [Zopfia rhizophila CBS 207.26]
MRHASDEIPDLPMTMPSIFTSALGKSFSQPSPFPIGQNSQTVTIISHLHIPHSPLSYSPTPLCACSQDSEDPELESALDWIHSSYGGLQLLVAKTPEPSPDHTASPRLSITPPNPPNSPTPPYPHLPQVC